MYKHMLRPPKAITYTHSCDYRPGFRIVSMCTPSFSICLLLSCGPKCCVASCDNTPSSSSQSTKSPSSFASSISIASLALCTILNQAINLLDFTCPNHCIDLYLVVIFTSPQPLKCGNSYFQSNDVLKHYEFIYFKNYSLI